MLRESSRKLKTGGELRLTESDARRLAQYSWPGNVRELQNVIERAAIIARNGKVRIDLPEITSLAYAGKRATASSRPIVLTDDDRRERDRINIMSALQASGGKIFGRGGAAELLDVKPTTLASRIKSLGIRFERPAPQARPDQRV
jgi:transcriptional regulator with GAF, ATPase, and Fis domain